MKKIITILYSMIIIAAFSLAGCNNDSSPEISEELHQAKTIIEELNQDYEGEYNLPIHPDYPVLDVRIDESGKEVGIPPTVYISYGLEKGELEERFEEVEFPKMYEESQQKLLYGIYKGKQIASITYSPGIPPDGYNGNDIVDEKEWVFNGKEITYYYIEENDNERREIPTDRIEVFGDGCQISLILREGFDEEAAREFAMLLKEKHQMIEAQ